MDIQAIKDHVHLLEQRTFRLPVYHYLRDIWLKEPKTEALTVLTMQQMVFYLIDLEYPWNVWEEENEHQTYQSFLHEVLEYGLEHCIHGKLFMWNLCYYLSSIGTYHFILGEQIHLTNVQSLLQQLLSSAKELYPTSVLFDILPLVQGGDIFWKEQLSGEVIDAMQAEVAEWKLMDNVVDEEIRKLFGM